MEKSKKQFTGIVVSNSRNKTISVEISFYVKHPLYGKSFKKTKKFQTHDEKEITNIGDKVLIEETRPISKTKKFRLISILEKSREGEK